MNLRDLKYLVAVAEHQHFGKAAKACFVSQPGLSMQLQKLEDELGVQLFERTNKKVMISPIGREIVARAKKVLQEAEALKQTAQTFQDPLAGDIKLGAFPTLAPYFLPHLVPQITKAMPKLNLFLIEEKTENLLTKLHDGELDGAFLALPLENEQGLVAQPLFEDPFLLATPPNHPLARKKKVSADDISGNQLLLLEDGHCLRNQALDVCHLMGVGEHKGFRATSLETLRQMVIAGAGITLIPQMAAIAHDGITYIPFEAPAPCRTIGLVWRQSSARHICLEKIAGLAKGDDSPY